MKIIQFIGLIVLLMLSYSTKAQGFQVAVLKYGGGGDYYANPTSVPNLVKFANEQLNLSINTDVPYVDAGSLDIFNYPFIHMTGHGNVYFTNSELENLRLYLLSGGFLHIDDNYGLDEFIRPEIQKLFPNEKLVELPFNHAVFKQEYKTTGLPKIHEHDGKRPQAFAVIVDGRVILLYTYETDLGDGWEDPSVHNNPQEKRQAALRMGANILQFVFSNGALE